MGKKTEEHWKGKVTVLCQEVDWLVQHWLIRGGFAGGFALKGWFRKGKEGGVVGFKRAVSRSGGGPLEWGK